MPSVTPALSGTGPIFVISITSLEEWMGQIKSIDGNASDSSETLEGYQKLPLSQPHDTSGLQWTNYVPLRHDWQHANLQMFGQFDGMHDLHFEQDWAHSLSSASPILSIDGPTQTY